MAASGRETRIRRPRWTVGGSQAAALRARQEQLLDDGLEGTFPASDPVAVMRLT